MSDIPPGDELTEEEEEEESESTVDDENVILPPFPNDAASTSHRKLACRGCWRPEGLGPVGGEWTPHNPEEQCELDLLIFRHGDETSWYALRPKPFDFRPEYVMCWEPKCEGLLCNYAHHQVEKTLWNGEKNGEFNISDFVDQCEQLHRGAGRFSNVVSPVANPQIQFPLKDSHNSRLCCEDCLRPVDTKPGSYSLDPEDHDCRRVVLVVRLKLADESSWVRVRERPLYPKFEGKRYMMCKSTYEADVVCYPNPDLCYFPHTRAEQGVWNADKAGRFHMSAFIKAHSGSTDPPVRYFLHKYPGHFLFLCRECFDHGEIMSEKLRHGFTCERGHHNWAISKALARKFLDGPECTLIHTRPDSSASSQETQDVICCDTHKYKCEARKKGTCPCVHTLLEKDLWELQRDHNIKVDDVIAESKVPSPTDGLKMRRHGRGTDVQPSEPCILQLTCEFQLEFVCGTCWQYGTVNPKDETGLKCQGPGHDWSDLDVCLCLPAKKVIRPLPQKRFKGGFDLCRDVDAGRPCRYVNMCTFGLSEEEVTIWNWMLTNKISSLGQAVCISREAKQLTERPEPTPYFSCDVCSEAYSSRQEWEDHCGSDLHTENVTSDKDQQWNHRPPPAAADSSQVKICPEHANGRNCRFSNLEDVSNFCKNAHCQDELEEWQARLDHRQKKRETPDYHSYMKAPLLDDKNAVGSQDQLKEGRGLRQELKFYWWTSASREIVRYPGRMDASDEELLQAYNSPTSEDAANQVLLSQKLNQYNYIHGMKNRLRLEELERHRILSKYNLETRIKCLSSISKDGGRPLECNETKGELFGEVQLRESITDDTDAGQLMSDVTRVWLAPSLGTADRVFEAVVVTKERFGLQFNSCDQIYICFSGVTVKELGLKHGHEMLMELQFQLDRLPFCRMYKALDDLGEGRFFLFPHVQNYIDVWTETSASALVKSDFLNDSQLTVPRYATVSHIGYTPPLVVSGPFGMGKTETFAHCAAYLALNRQEARILICTHSNSGADLYVTRLKRFNDRKPFDFCRINGVHRRIKTVPDEVKTHCLLNEHRSGFRHPTIEDIEGQKIVIVTLSSSLMITREAKLKGHFTHIFIDEAAQALEAEVIMPLALAVPGTCVVLAGDDQQISPPVYSRHGDLSISILQRLKTYYKDVTPSAGNEETEPPFTVLLSENYRSRKEIVDVLSTAYDGPSIECSRNYDAPKDVPAMAFYETKGQETIANNSTSYTNEAEVQEVVLRVGDLMERWPKDEWGEPDQGKVAVVSPYHDQVYQIHSALQDKLPGVHVVGVNNIQGMEFFAVFISTVRTVKPDDNVQATETEETHQGFLSNKQLLITALTRTRDFVAVVGDPVALLLRSSDACKFVWRGFLNECDVSKSLFPTTLTLKQIQDEVQHVQSLRSHSKRRLLGEFELVRWHPEKGGFGTVFEARNLTDKTSYAIKVIRLSHDEARRDHVLQAVQARAQLDHPGIVRYCTSWEEDLQGSSYEAAMTLLRRRTASLGSGPSSDRKSAPTDVQPGQGEVQEEASQPRQGRSPARASSCKCLVIQMELCKEKTLRDWLEETKDPPRVEILYMFCQIVSAIEHVHSKGLMHQELSSKNIFLTPEGKVKVENFGRALTGPPGQDLEASSDDTDVYMSPEQVAKEDYDEKVDIFSLGLLLLEMSVPFSSDKEREDTLQEAKQGRYPDTFKQKHSEEYEMVHSALDPNRKNRPTSANLSSQLLELRKHLTPGNLVKFEQIKNREEFYLGERLVGESQVIEYKRGLQGDDKGNNLWAIPRTVCAFLNQDQGGVMLLGVDEILTEGGESIGQVVGVCQPDAEKNEDQRNWFISKVNEILKKIEGMTGLGADPRILPVYDRDASPFAEKTPASRDGKHLYVIRITVEPRVLRGVPRCCVVVTSKGEKKGQKTKDNIFYVRKDLQIFGRTQQEVFMISLNMVDQQATKQNETDHQAGGAAG